MSELTAYSAKHGFSRQPRAEISMWAECFPLIANRASSPQLLRFSSQSCPRLLSRAACSQ